MSRHNERIANMELQNGADERQRWAQVLGAPRRAPHVLPTVRRSRVPDVLLALTLGLALAWLLVWGLSK